MHEHRDEVDAVVAELNRAAGPDEQVQSEVEPLSQYRHGGVWYPFGTEEDDEGEGYLDQDPGEGMGALEDGGGEQDPGEGIGALEEGPHGAQADAIDNDLYGYHDDRSQLQYTGPDWTSPAELDEKKECLICGQDTDPVELRTANHPTCRAAQHVFCVSCTNGMNVSGSQPKCPICRAAPEDAGPGAAGSS